VSVSAAKGVDLACENRRLLQEKAAVLEQKPHGRRLAHGVAGDAAPRAALLRHSRVDQMGPLQTRRLALQSKRRLPPVI